MTFVGVAAQPALLHGRLNESVPQLVARYGQNFEVVPTGSGPIYQFRSARLCVDVTVRDGISVCETSYGDAALKGGQPPAAIVRGVMGANVPGAKWTDADVHAREASAFASRDGVFHAAIFTGAEFPYPKCTFAVCVRRAEALDNVRLAGPGRPPAAAPESPAAVEPPAPAPVRVTAAGPGRVAPAPWPERANGAGTGFFVSPRGYLATCEHVVHGASRLEVRTAAGQTLAARVVAADPHNDVAILKVEAAPAAASGQAPTAENEEFPYLVLARSTSARLGQSVFKIGFPNTAIQGTNAKFTRGDISALTGMADDVRTFQVSVPVGPGNSGGALVNERGEALGIINATLNSVAVARVTGGVVPQSVAYALKAEVLLPLTSTLPELRELSPDPPNVPGLASGGQTLRSEEVIGRVETSTVRVLAFAPEPPPDSPAPGARALVRAETTPPDPLAARIYALARAREADRRMGEVYTMVRSRLAPSGKDALKRVQMDWLRVRAGQTGSDELLARGMGADTDALRRFAEMDEARTVVLLQFLRGLR